MKKTRIAVFTLLALLTATYLAACSGPGDAEPAVGTAGGAQALTIDVEGPGVVVLDDLDMTCSDECTVQTGAGVELELRAQADAGKGFVGWQQACGGIGNCTLTMNGDLTVRAVFAHHVLSLDFQGDGQGTARIVPPDVSCTDDCGVGFPSPVTSSVTITLDEGTRLAGWGGECSGNGTSRYCQVQVDGLTGVTVNMTSPPVANRDSYSVQAGDSLSVRAGNGVLSNDSGAVRARLESGATQGELNFNSDGSFTYTPESGASGGDSFSYRAEDDSGNESEATGVSIAIMEPDSFPLNVAVTGSGAGSVSSSDGAIDCPDDCNSAYVDGTTVTLTAQAGARSSFDGWSGDCDNVSGTTCTVNVDEAKNVTASFRFQLFQLEFDSSGSGSGTVTFDPAGTGAPGNSCSSSCTRTYDSGTLVLLTAEADPGSTFVGWQGACDDAPGPNCEVEMLGDSTATAVFEQVEEFEVSVTLAGDGSGKVVSQPAGIACPGTCSHSFQEGDSVTLTATPDEGNDLTGWSGACTGTGETCTFTPGSNSTVTATFEAESEPVEYTLTVSQPANGTITSGDGQISCGQGSVRCEGTYGEGAPVSLTASGATGYEFSSWTGACEQEASSTCTLEMNANANVSASFSPTPENQASVSLIGDGSGVVVSSPAGIDCSSDNPDGCTAMFPQDQQVSLQPSSNDGSSFAGWSGDCSGTGSCNLDMSEERDVSAQFELEQAALTLSFQGDGSGSVNLDPPGTACDANCKHAYEPGETVSLTALADEGSEFTGWGGDDCADTADSTCEFAISDDTAVSVTFAAMESSGNDDDDGTDDGTTGGTAGTAGSEDSAG